MKRHLWLLLAWPAGYAQAAAPIDCLAVAPLTMVVQIGATTRQVLLLGGGAQLRIQDAVSGELLWSAGSTGAVTQHFDSMTAPFAGSLAALDTDHDGLHDRLYAGDLDGRLWRFDLHNGAAASSWTTGGVFADFSNDEGRGFLAPPDVSLASAPGTSPWLHIAIGTAAPGRLGANNRFYVLRDHAPFEAWSNQQYLDWQPLHEGDLLQVDSAAQPTSEEIQAGWYVELGQGDVVSAALTVAGRTVLAIADSVLDVTGCRSAFSIATLELSAGRVRLDAQGNWRRPLDGMLALGSTFALAMGTNPGETNAVCAFDAARVAECDVDLRPRRTWWRREDAE